jgi:peptidoglycan/xylan/chitin deacetylase (PgdA/CDA1 family)
MTSSESLTTAQDQSNMLTDPEADSASPRRRVDPVIITMSWDDGHVLDQRMADLLHTYGLKGTFYVAPRNEELPKWVRLRDRELCNLAAEFEIGGHTLSHVNLTKTPDREAAREINEGKDALEQVIGSSIRSFCYPYGAYDKRHPSMARSAGFSYARTIRRYITSAVLRPMEANTTVHACRHLCDLPAMLRLANGSAVRANRFYRNWDVLAMALFDEVLSAGGVYHLWGHSWEIERNRDWDRLERVLEYIGRRPRAQYVSNCDTVTRSAAPNNCNTRKSH